MCESTQLVTQCLSSIPVGPTTIRDFSLVMQRTAVKKIACKDSFGTSVITASAIPSLKPPPKVELGIFLVSFFETSIPILWHHMLADVVTIVGAKDILGD
jgi:hypothetical protein